MISGTVIVLNGTSSSGKSSIARELQQTMDGYYLHSGLDHFTDRLPAKFLVVSDGISPATADCFRLVVSKETNRVVEIRLGPFAFKLWAGIYRAVAALASVGIDVIVDDLLLDPRVIWEAANALSTYKAFFVGVRCPAEVAERRGQRRGDRLPGLVTVQSGMVHRHGCYDLEVDTLAMSPRECAQRIQRALLSGATPTAFRKLRESMAEEYLCHDVA